MRAVASVLNVGWHVLVGFVLGLMASGFVVAVFGGLLPETPLFLVVMLIIVGVTAAGLREGLWAYKARPRGLGLRRVTKWKDGARYFDWEKY